MFSKIKLNQSTSCSQRFGSSKNCTRSIERDQAKSQKPKSARL